MEVHAALPTELPGPTGLTLRIGARRFSILSQTRDTCLIRAPEGAPPRGYADIYEGEAHRAHCLIVLSAPEGDCIRLTYKRRTAVGTGPAPDFAPE
jgi:hypothetical protein